MHSFDINIDQIRPPLPLLFLNLKPHLQRRRRHSRFIARVRNVITSFTPVCRARMELPSTTVAIINMQVEAEQTLLEQEYSPSLLVLACLVCRPVGPGDPISIGGIPELNHPFHTNYW